MNAHGNIIYDKTIIKLFAKQLIFLFEKKNSFFLNFECLLCLLL